MRTARDDSNTAGSTKVLVLADTHLTVVGIERMPSEVWEFADRSDVILHAGDVTTSQVLDARAPRASTHAVLGNNDRDLVDALPMGLILELGGVKVAMLHDSGPTAGGGRRMARRFPDAEMVVFGHSHQPVCGRTEEGQLLVNPGPPTQRRRQPVHPVGWIELSNGAVSRAWVVPIGPRPWSRVMNDYGRIGSDRCAGQRSADRRGDRLVARWSPSPAPTSSPVRPRSCT